MKKPSEDFMNVGIELSFILFLSATYFIGKISPEAFWVALSISMVSSQLRNLNTNFSKFSDYIALRIHKIIKTKEK